MNTKEFLAIHASNPTNVEGFENRFSEFRKEVKQVAAFLGAPEHAMWNLLADPQRFRALFGWAEHDLFLQYYSING